MFNSVSQGPTASKNDEGNDQERTSYQKLPEELLALKTEELLKANRQLARETNRRKELEAALQDNKETLAKYAADLENNGTALRVLMDNRAEDKKQLEDLYLPFKPKRKTRATVARQRGLQPLAEILLRQETLNHFHT